MSTYHPHTCLHCQVQFLPQASLQSESVLCRFSVVSYSLFGDEVTLWSCCVVCCAPWHAVWSQWKKRGVSSSGGVGGSTCALRINYTNMKVQKKFVTPVRWDGNFSLSSRIAVTVRCFSHYFNLLGAVCLLEEFSCAVSSLCRNCVLDDFEAKRDVSLNLSFTAKLFNLKWKCKRSIWAVMAGVRFMAFFLLFRWLVTVLSTFVSRLVRKFCFLVYCVPGVVTACYSCPLLLCV